MAGARVAKRFRWLSAAELDATEFNQRDIIPGNPEPVDAGTLKAGANEIDAMPEARRFIGLYGMHSEGKLTVSKLQFWGGQFWAWDGLRYRPLTIDEMRSFVWRHLDASFARLTRSAVSNVLEGVKSQTQQPSQIEMPSWLGGNPPFPLDELLVTRSGLVHLPSVVENRDHLIQLTPRLFSANVLDFGFDINAPPPRQWLKFLSELWPDEPQSIATLQMWMGLLLTADTSLQKILLLIGPRRSGKGTIGRVIRGLIGKDNVAGPTLAGLATNFGLSSLLGKSAAVISDARMGKRTDPAIVTERLLSISGEDAVDVDRKHLPIVTVKLSARITILTNEIPGVVDSSGALAGRMIILRLTESFYGNEDRELFDKKLVPELPGILLWSIEGWRLLREVGHLTQPDSGVELLTHMEDLASPISRFLRDRCVLNPTARSSVDEMYTAWREWCMQNGHRYPGTKESFGRDLHAAVPKLRTVQLRGPEGRYRAFEGVGLLIQVTGF